MSRSTVVASADWYRSVSWCVLIDVEVIGHIVGAIVLASHAPDDQDGGDYEE